MKKYKHSSVLLVAGSFRAGQDFTHDDGIQHARGA